VSNCHPRRSDDHQNRRRLLHLVGDRPSATDAAQSLRLNRSTAAGTSAAAPTEVGDVWIQVLGVIREVQLTISAYENERATFEAWAAEQRAAIEQARASVELERAELRAERRRRSPQP
jgi:hypothetical protein